MTQNKVKGVRYLQMDELIKKAYIEYIKQYSTMPTQEEIANICGVKRKTVWIHLHDMDLNDIIEPFKVFGPSVLMGLVNRAKKGDSKAVELYMKLAYKYKETHDIEGEIKNVIEVRYVDGKKKD